MVCFFKLGYAVAGGGLFLGVLLEFIAERHKSAGSG